MTRRIDIDGYSILIDELPQHNQSIQYINDAGGAAEKALNWTANQIAAAMKPAVSILDSLRNSAKEMSPDEMEISMQFDLALNGEVPVFKIASAEASAQIAVKLVWKKEHD